MNPITAVLGIAGLGMQIFGGASAAADQQRAYEIQQKISGVETQVNDQRKQQMNLDSQRQQLEIVRNSQRARSMALNSATNQGAQFGTGLQGGYGQISGQTNTNLLANSQNLEIGNNIFGLNNQISQYKSQLSGVQSDIAQDTAWSNMGATIGKSASTVSDLYGYGKSLLS